MSAIEKIQIHNMVSWEDRQFLIYAASFGNDCSHDFE